MGRLTLTLCDAAGNPLAVDGPLLGVTGATVTLEQLDLFEGHQATISGDFRRNLAALAPWTTVKIVEAGVGLVAWGVIVNPSKQINDQGNTIALTMPNIAEQMRLSDTGLGWIASTGIGTIVARLGSLKNGWSALFTDSGPNIISTGPVQWTTTNAQATANTLTKNGGAAAAWDAGGISLQAAAGGDCAVSFVALSATTNVMCGLTQAAGFQPYPTMNYGIWVGGGNLYTVEKGGIVGPLAPILPGDILRVSVESGVVIYSKNNIEVRRAAVAPTYPLRVAGYVYETNTQLGAAVFTRLTAPAEAWYAIRFEQSPILGALTDLAKQTFHHVRLAKRATDAPDRSYLAGDPYRAIEFGSFGAPSTIRLISATGGAVSAINANPDVRIISDFQRNRDATNVINSLVPLGGGTGDAQVTIERCWRIVNDPTYPNYGRYGNVPGTVFPEYDPLYPLPAIIDGGGKPRPARRTRDGLGMEIAVTLDGRYEYRLADPASIAYWDTVMPHEGELRGTFTDSQFVYGDATDGNQEVTQRALYVAAKTKLRYMSMTNDAVSVTTTGGGRVPRAGDLVHVQYRRTGQDAQGIFTEEDIDADYTVMSVKRTYDDKGPVRDAWKLSDKANLPGSNQSAAANAARTMSALQVVPTTGLALLPVTGASDVDSTHPYDKTIPLPGELFRVRSAPLHVEFKPVRHNVAVAANTTHQHSYTIPSLGVNVSVTGTATITSWGGATATINNWSSGTATITSWGGATASTSNWGSTSANISNWSSVGVTITNWAGTFTNVTNWGGTSVSGSATITDFSHVTAGIAASGYTQTNVNAAVPQHDNQASHGTGVNAGAHTNGLPTASGGMIVATPIDVDAKAHGAVKYGSAGTSPATTYVTDVQAFVTTGQEHTHGLSISQTQGASYSVAPAVNGYQGSATISQFGTQGGGFTLSGVALGGMAGTVSGTATGATSGTAGGSLSGTLSVNAGSFSGTAYSTISGTATGQLGGTATGQLSGTAFGTISGTGTGTTTATGTGSTSPQLQTIGPSGGHTHDLTPGIVDSNTQMSIQLWIDGGDGNFIDRSPELGGPWTKSFDVADIARYIQAPGRKVRVRIQPTAAPGQIDGLGSVEIFGTFVVELGGVSSVVYAA